jgi:hypothetical protein
MAAVPAAAGFTVAVAVNAVPVYQNGPEPNDTDVVVGALSIVMLAEALLASNPSLPAKVAVAVQELPTFVQSPEYVIVAEPASAGVTVAVAVNALPVYTNGPAPKLTVVVVGTLDGA